MVEVAIEKTLVVVTCIGLFSIEQYGRKGDRTVLRE